MSQYEFLTGAAGTGKSYTLKERMGRKEEDYILTATTGIAAINLGTGVTTINSLLKYYDTKSLEDAFRRKWLLKRLKHLSGVLVIDEVSMMAKEQLEIIMDAIDERNNMVKDDGLKLLLTGDFLQLPPVKAKFCFHAKQWNKFEVTKLTKVWRQSNPEFLAAINYARSGEGDKFAQAIFDNDSITKLSKPDDSFEGTTIFATNNEVNQFNELRLKRLISEGNKTVRLQNVRWGKSLTEWKEIPDEIMLAKNAQIMTLANAKSMAYVNGSQGKLVDWIPNEKPTALVVALSNNDGTLKPSVNVTRVIRRNMVDDLFEEDTPQIPDQLSSESDEDYKVRLDFMTKQARLSKPPNTPYFDFWFAKWCIGELIYWPVRLSYAMTVHKTQGLSLDRVQICPTNDFFASPAMMYVAISRCKTPEGLTIVGNPYKLEAVTNTDYEVMEWI